MRARISCFLVLALALGACGRHQAAVDHARSATTAATALVPPAAASAPAASAAQRQGAGLASGAGTTVRANEDGSETLEDSAGDSGNHNALLAAVASTMAATTSAASAQATAAPTLWKEGVHYTRLVPAQPTAVASGQVEVLEFFWYGCPHCYALDPLVESWKKAKPAYVGFSRVPVMWSEAHRSAARLFYALESMHKLDQLHTEVFKEIHVNGNPLIMADPNDTAGAERVQVSFVRKFGISEDAFKQAAHSFAVETALQRADQLVLRYRIEGVPAFVINGKYVADVRSAGGQERIMSLVDDLAAQERKH